jgi:hypothetical protein
LCCCRRLPTIFRVKTLKMEVIFSSRTFITISKTIWHHNPLYSEYGSIMFLQNIGTHIQGHTLS